MPGREFAPCSGSSAEAGAPTISESSLAFARERLEAQADVGGGVYVGPAQVGWQTHEESCCIPPDPKYIIAVVSPVPPSFESPRFPCETGAFSRPQGWKAWSRRSASSLLRGSAWWLPSRWTGAPASGGAVGGVSPIAMNESERRVCHRSWLGPDVFHRRASMAGELEAVPIPTRMFSKQARQPSRA